MRILFVVLPAFGCLSLIRHSAIALTHVLALLIMLLNYVEAAFMWKNIYLSNPTMSNRLNLHPSSE